MTNEKAIDVIMHMLANTPTNVKEDEALGMAVGALHASKQKGAWSNGNHIGESERVRTCSNCRITQTVNTHKGKVMFRYCPYCGSEMNPKSNSPFW
mgnify:CR=1 FL=1